MDYVVPGTLLKTKRGFQVYFWSKNSNADDGYYKGFFLVVNEGQVIRLDQHICGYFLTDDLYQDEAGLLDNSKILTQNSYQPRRYEKIHKIFKVIKP